MSLVNRGGHDLLRFCFMVSATIQGLSLCIEQSFRAFSLLQKGGGGRNRRKGVQGKKFEHNNEILKKSGTRKLWFLPEKSGLQFKTTLPHAVIQSLRFGESWWEIPFEMSCI